MYLSSSVCKEMGDDLCKTSAFSQTANPDRYVTLHEPTDRPWQQLQPPKSRRRVPHEYRRLYGDEPLSDLVAAHLLVSAEGYEIQRC
jgi:hypothetical protein